MEDQEKLSLRKQAEILNLQKDVLSRQISKLRDDIAAEKTEFQKTQTKLQDDIRLKDIEIRAVRNYMEKRSGEIKNQLKDEFQSLEMEKARIAEVTKELDARRNMIESLVTAKQAEFEKQLRTEKELFEKSREEYLKNTKKLQASLDEHIHKGATESKHLEEEINDLREQLLLKDQALAESQKTAASLLTETSGKDGQIEELRNELSSLAGQKEALAADKETLSRALDEKTNLLGTANNSAETLKKSAGQIKAAMFAREKEISEKTAQYKEKMSELNSETDSLKKDNKKLAESTKRLSALENEKKALLKKIDDIRQQSEISEANADALLSSKQAEFEKQLRTEKELFEKSREEYLKNTKKLQASLDEHIHKGATESKHLEEEINALSKQLLLKDQALAESQKTAASLLTETSGKDSQLEELKKEISSLAGQKETLAADKETLSRALDEKTNLLGAANNSAETLKKSAGQIKAAMFAREKEIAEKITQYKEKMSELNSETDSLKKDNKKLVESTKRLSDLENEKKALLKKIDDIRQQLEISEANAAESKHLEEKINALSEQLLLKDQALAESQKTAASLLAEASGKDSQLEELKKEISSLANQKDSLAADKEALSRALDEKTNLLGAANDAAETLRKSAGQIKAAMFAREKEISEKTAQTINELRRLAEKDKKLLDSFTKRLIALKKDQKKLAELKNKNMELAADKEALSRALDEKTNLLGAANDAAETLRKSAGQIKAAMFAREKEISEKTAQYKEKMSELKQTVEVAEKEKKALLDKIDNLRLQSKESEKTADALLVAIQKNETLQKLNAALEKKLSKQESAQDKKHKKSIAPAKPRGAEKFKCSECGAIVGAHDKKCPSCGEKFE